MKTLLPIFSPTQVILVDDNPQTLKGLKSTFDQNMVICKVFDNPFEAIEYINNVSDNILHPTQSGESLLSGNIETFYEDIYSPTRFQKISTVITDYDMPGMNGIELCKNINSPHIQKIILTGAASEKLAVEAFNSKIIDYFIQKSDIDLLEKLENLVMQNQEKYFASITNNLMQIVSYEDLDYLGINDTVFIEFFHALIKDKKVCEYYLLDSLGNSLFLSEDGKVSALFVFDDRLMMDQENMIPEEECNKNKELLQDIHLNKKAICYYEFKDHTEYKPSDWKNFVYPLSRLEGRQTYYWSYVPTLPYFDKDKVISFNQYKDINS